MNLFDEFTVFENIAIALPATRRRGHDMIGSGICRSPRWSTKLTAFWKRWVSQDAPTMKPSRSLMAHAARSKSASRWPVVLSCFFSMNRPRVWVATGGARLADLILQLKGDLTIVIIEHDMEFLFSLADEISVIHWGQVIARGAPAALKTNPWVEASNSGAAQLMLDVSSHRFFLRRDAGAVLGLVVRARRRGACPARRQRSGQNHGASLHPRSHARRAGATSVFRESRSRPARRIISHVPASAGCRTTVASVRHSPWRKICRWAKSARRFEDGLSEKSPRFSHRSNI